MIRTVIKIAAIFLLISLFLPSLLWYAEIVFTLVVVIWLISLL